MDYTDWQKRLGSVVTLCALIFTIFTGRLYEKAIVEHAAIVREADNQYAVRKEVSGQRGDILVKLADTTYYPLATNERRYQVLVVPNNVADAAKISRQLSPLIGMDAGVIFNKINNKKLLYVPPLAHRLTKDQADKIASLNLRGVELLPELVRTYPEDSLASQILGFVNNDGKGNYGIEGTFDLVLRGEKGYQVGERDSTGRVISVSDDFKPKDGATIVLSVDREIQHYVEKTLAAAVKQYQADSGSVVIVNPKTGAIVAMASWPDFNPNTYNTVDNAAKFTNPAIADVWEPGSIMKPLVMSLAIDKGLVEPDTASDFGASVRVLNHDIWTAEKKAFGHETMTQVLENSDNVGMVWVGDKLGNDSEYNGLKQYGFGSVPSLNLNTISTGYLAPLKSWNDLTRATITFGQGVSVTPLQITMAYAALANKGVLMQPYIVSEVIDKNGILAQTQPKQVRRVVSTDTANKLTTMLESVVTNGLGKKAQVPGFRIGGKTGTAQVPDPKGGYYDNNTIGSFAGYFPLSNPQYAMLVKLDNPKAVNFAESSAGPTFGQIAQWILNYKQIPPDKQ